MNSTKWWTAATLALVLLITGIGTAMASRGDGMGMRDGDCRGSKPGDNPMDRHLEKMSKFLDLTADQQTAIQQIMTDHRAQADSHRQQMQEARAAMLQQKGAGFSEDEVRKAAELSGSAYAEMMVDRARMHNEMDAVLTVEQRQLAEKLAMLQCEGEGQMRHGGMNHKGMNHGGMMAGCE